MRGAKIAFKVSSGRNYDTIPTNDNSNKLPRQMFIDPETGITANPVINGTFADQTE